MFVFVVYCPLTHVEIVKRAMFDAGGGKIGLYEKCSFEYEGVGQFEATKGASPFLGEVGCLEQVKEKKIEIACNLESVAQVLKAMRSAHPYEEPAFHILKNYSLEFED